MERKAIGNKLRFEVFKRDSFTCQYCGKKAPEIILRVDHIDPVKNGGDNNIINLITSCFECNSGKGATLLTDRTMLEKQQEQLEELQERRVQLEMMMEWRTDLLNAQKDSVEIYVKRINHFIHPYVVSENFKITIKKIVKESKPDAILDAIEEAYDRHAVYVDDEITQASVNIMLDKLRGIAKFKSLPPKEQKISWLQILVKNKYHVTNKYFSDLLFILWEWIRGVGITEEKALEFLQVEIKDMIDDNYSYNSLIDELQGMNARMKERCEKNSSFQKQDN